MPSGAGGTPRSTSSTRRCALERSWPLLTATPADYADLAEGLVVESLQ
ncbi:hypothetical protein WCD74_24845 [Actinomycetospora sp. OC33-EN08]|uniref:Uncharacterized protein n=1 Tax=Actinomycetospora aurantiaca TaxID=3129233 RepID=A0ABU8MUL6_9PSEU